MNNNNQSLTARERVIKKNIDSIREEVIARQLEGEYIEVCLERAKSVISSLESHQGTEQERMQLASAKEAVAKMEGTLGVHKEVAEALLAKLSFYKEKREEARVKREDKKEKRNVRLAEKAMNDLDKFPDKIDVNMANIRFVEGKKKNK